MAVQGFKGSRAIESEEAEYKGLVRGLLLGCALPSVMLCVFLWNTGVSTNIVSKDVGAPIEVMERMKAVEGLEPKAARKVFFRGANRTVVRDPKNPLTEARSTILAQQRLRLFSIKQSKERADAVGHKGGEERKTHVRHPPRSRKGSFTPTRAAPRASGPVGGAR